MAIFVTSSKYHPRPSLISYAILSRGFMRKGAYGKSEAPARAKSAILKEDYGVELKLEEVLDVALVLIGFAETAMKIEAKMNSS